MSRVRIFRMYRMYRIFRGRLFAFSLIEVMVALLVVAIIVAALAPVITKRMQRDIVGRSRISTSCSSLFPEGYCGMCYLNPKSCIVCTKTCKSDEFQNVSECSCVLCSKSTSTTQGSVAVNTAMSSCSTCNSGYYAGIQGQSVGCNKCPGGYYCPSGKLIPCSKGYYCPQGSSSQKACPSGKYSSSANASSCSTCPSGTYSNAGASSCISCPKGSYSSSSGSSSCTKVC